MSLINDALRRANQSKQGQPPEPSGGAPMQPVHPNDRSPSSATPLWIFFLIALLLICGGWLFWKGFASKTTATKVESPTVNPPVASTSRVVEVKAPVASTNVIVAPVAVATNAPAVVAESTATNVPPPIEPSPVAAAPALKLQGIFYRSISPGALINGISVTTGEKVFGARVLKIDRQEVTLERDGKTIVLTLQR